MNRLRITAYLSALHSVVLGEITLTFWSVIMNVSPTGNTVTDTKMEVLRDFVLNTNVLKSAFQISGEGIGIKYESLANAH